MRKPDEVLSRQAEPPDIVLRYADHSDALVDVYLPTLLGQPSHSSRLIVFVHGGFWRQEIDRTHARPLAVALQRRGWAVALPEYRRTGGRGGWPQTAYDVEAALIATPRMLDEIAPGHIDPAAAVVLCGHSAGGHLALWAGLRAHAGTVGSIVALAPVADLRYAARAGMGDSAVEALLGGTPDEMPSEYADADIIRMLPGSVDVTIIQGTADEQVAVQMNRQLSANFDGAEHFHYLELVGVDHFALIDPLSREFETVVLPALSKI